jgi:hypothetical protein
MWVAKTRSGESDRRREGDMLCIGGDTCIRAIVVIINPLGFRGHALRAPVL